MDRRKALKGVLVFLMIFVLLININMDSEVLAEGYKFRDTIKNVGMLKEFRITFSEELNPATVKSAYIKVYTYDKDKVRHSVRVELDKKDKRVIKITPFNRYKQGKKYKIVIESGVESINGENLGEGIVIPFEVKNFYAGLPVEGGIIIVGNEAYSVEYLAENGSRKNEILNGNYKVFYINELMKNKIKDVIGGEFVDGTELPPEYNFKKPVYYTDENGKRSMYVWDYNIQEFKKVDPQVKFKVTVNAQNTTNKILMIKIEDVEWLENVGYYRLNSSNTFYKISEPSIFSTKDFIEKITFYSNAMTKLGETYMSTIAEGTYKRKLKVFDVVSEGNSAGNIINNGYVAADENGYILYNNTGDGNKLYKNDTNGIFHSVISDDFAQYINVSEEWVYYSNYTDKGKLYRMKIDGSSKQKLNDEYTAFINIIGDDIYYSNYSNSGRITRIKRDGSDAMTDEKGLKHGRVLSLESEDEAYFLNIVGDWLYYSNLNDHHRVYAINKSGNYRLRLSDEGASSIQVVDEWIYYTNNKGKLKKVKKDGSKETEDLGGVVAKFDRGYFFNVVDDWIYYSNAEDSNRLYKIKVDGTEKTRLTREKVTYINVAYNTIYFVSGRNMFTLPIDSVGKTKPLAVKKVESTKKVVQVDDVIVTVPHGEVNENIEWLESKYLPSKVPGILSDNRMQQFVVQWDKKGATVQNGVRKYRGKLIGYNQYINLDMSIPSEMINETTTIAIYNNAGTRTGHMEIYSDPVSNDEINNPPKLQEGDLITIYADEKLTVPLRVAPVRRTGVYNKAVFANFDLDRYGIKEYYVSIKRQGKAPSKGNRFTIGEAPVITNSIHKPVRDIDDEGLGIDGRDFYIEELKLTKNKAVISSQIYLTRRGTRLALQDRDIIPFDNKYLSGTSWIGRRYQDDSVTDKVTMNIDSFGNLLIGESYDMYIVSKYVDNAAPDNRGGNPKIEGWAVSDATPIDVKSEDLPYDPGLPTMTRKYGETVTLQVTPKVGETAYLIPVWESKFEDPNYKQYIDEIWLKDAQNWLYESKTWLKQNGPWPFKDGHSAVENGHITKLEGDGRSNVMPVPTGFAFAPEDDADKLNNKYYAPNVKYKLVIINDIGVSALSGGTLTVDNKPPVIIENFIEGDNKYIKSGEPIRFQSKYENADVYISYQLDNLVTLEQLNEAVNIKAAYKFSVLSGVTTLLPSNAIKPDTIKDSMNYKIMVADKVGNLREVGLISVYVDTDDLTQIIEDATSAISTGNVLQLEIDMLKDKLKESQTMLDKINSPYRTDIVTQSEINKLVNDFRNLLIQLGIPHKNDKMKNYDQITLTKNFLKNIRFFNNHGSAVNLSSIDQDVWLPTQFGYKTDYSFNIEWEVTDEGSSAKYIETVGSNIGTIYRPSGENPTDKSGLVLKAIVSNDAGLKFEVTHLITIKAKRFVTSVTVPLSNRAIISAKGVTINSASDIAVKVFNTDLNAFVNSIDYDGVTYRFDVKRNSNGIDWDVVIVTENGDAGALSGETRNIQITIQGVIMNKQIKLRIPLDGTNAVFMSY